MCIYTLFKIIFHIGYYIVLNIVPCAIQSVLMYNFLCYIKKDSAIRDVKVLEWHNILQFWEYFFLKNPSLWVLWFAFLLKTRKENILIFLYNKNHEDFMTMIDIAIQYIFKSHFHFYLETFYIFLFSFNFDATLKSKFLFFSTSSLLSIS